MATATSVQHLTATMPSPTVKKVKPLTLEQFWDKYSDRINRVNNKLEEYFQAGMLVVWHIFPQQQLVYVYTSSIDVKICRNYNELLTLLSNAKLTKNRFQQIIR